MQHLYTTPQKKIHTKKSEPQNEIHQKDAVVEMGTFDFLLIFAQEFRWLLLDSYQVQPIFQPKNTHQNSPQNLGGNIHQEKSFKHGENLGLPLEASGETEKKQLWKVDWKIFFCFPKSSR